MNTINKFYKIAFAVLFVIIAGSFVSVSKAHAAYLNITGFETGDTSEMWPAIATAPVLTIQTAVKRSGTYAMKCVYDGLNPGFAIIGAASKASGPPVSFGATNGYMTFYFRIGVAASSQIDIAEMSTPNGTGTGVRIYTDATRVLRIKYINSAGVWTQVGSDSSALSLDTWYRIEVKLISPGIGGSTAVELKIDGTSVASGTGLTLQTPGAFGQVSLGANGNPAQTATFYFDDVAISDSAYPGAGQVNILKPTSMTNSWTTGTYTSVNEVPPNGDTSYVSATSNGLVAHFRYDTSATGGVSGNIGTVKQIALVRQVTGPMTVQMYSMTQSFAGMTTTLINPGASYVAIAKLNDTYPDTGVAWTTANIDGSGVGVANSGTGEVRATALYAMVWSTGSLAPTTVGTAANDPAASYYVTLKGSANPNGYPTTGHFRVYNYNPGNCNSDADGVGIIRYPRGDASFPDLNLGSGTSVVSAPTFSYTIPFNAGTFLTPNTTYYYCAYAVNTVNSTNYTSGSTSGGSSGVVSFTTPDGPTNPCDAPVTGDMTVPAGASCNFSNSFNGVDSVGGGRNVARLYGSPGAVMTINPGVKVAAGGFWPSGGSLYIGAGGMFFPGSHVYVHDADGDGILDDNLTYTGTTPPAGYITRPNFVSTAPNSATLNYASKLSATASFDCNPSSPYAYRYVQNLVKDADQDGYKTAAVAAQQCVGASATINGRVYYNDGSGPN